MPKPPPMLTTRTGAGAERRAPRRDPGDLRCASQIASALRFCEPLKMWKPSNASPSRPISSRTAGTSSASTPNCLGPPPIFMPEDLSSKSGLTRTATRAGAARSRSPTRASTLDFARRLDVDQDAGGDRLAQLGVALARAREADLARFTAGVASATRSSPAEATSSPSTSARHVGDERGHRIRLHRVVQLDRLAANAGAAASTRSSMHAPVVGVERRAADRRGELGQRHAADDEAVVRDGKLRHRRMSRKYSVHALISAKSSSNSAGKQLAVDLAVRVARQRPGAHVDSRRHHVGRQALPARGEQSLGIERTRHPSASPRRRSPGRAPGAARRTRPLADELRRVERLPRSRSG